jgi:hypothetical protein
MCTHSLFIGSALSTFPYSHNFKHVSSQKLLGNLWATAPVDLCGVSLASGVEFLEFLGQLSFWLPSMHCASKSFESSACSRALGSVRVNGKVTPRVGQSSVVTPNPLVVD